MSAAPTYPILAGGLTLDEKALEFKACDALLEVRDLKKPADEHWQEVKFDGFRIKFIVLAGGTVHAISRGFKFQDGKLPELYAAFGKLPAGTVIDGEIVALRK